MDIVSVFAKLDVLPYKEQPKFADIVNKRSSRRDLHAILLLDELCPSDSPIIGCAEHDQIWFSVDIDELNNSGISLDQVKELYACGLSIDEWETGLTKFV